MFEDIVDNGDWEKHKEVVYHKIDGNTEKLQQIGQKQDTILERLRKREIKAAVFEGTISEKVDKLEKIVYGILLAAGTAVVLQLLNLLIGNGTI